MARGSGVKDDDVSGGPDVAPAAGQQRLDKWLWFARIVKSRTLAASLVTSGKIRVNRVKAEKPSHWVKPGDVITSSAQREIRIFRVLRPGMRRGPAVEAQTLYEDLTQRTGPDSTADNLRQGAASKIGAREPGAGRPTKLERRQTERLKGR